MSNNLSHHTALTALVLDSPRSKLCAFHRAAAGLDMSRCALPAAQRLGFSIVEAVGVILGWDRAGGSPIDIFLGDHDEAERMRGEMLGLRLYTMANAAGLVGC
jgi:hypothetical protein